MDFIWIIIIVILGPLIGTLLGTFLRPNDKFLSISFAFTAGVMLAVSFFELVPQAIEGSSGLTATGAFFGGFILMLLVDIMIPHFHTTTGNEEASFERTTSTIYTGVLMHNLPEGFAIGAGFSLDARLGLLIAIAIAFHDVPETLIPVASRSRIKKGKKRAIFTGLSVMLSTLAGIFLGHFLLSGIPVAISASAIGISGGIMVYLAADELLPTAYDFGFVHLTNLSLILGIIFIMILKSTIGV